MINPLVVWGYVIISLISTILFFLTLFFFGKLIFLQLRIWILASRGFINVEIIGLDKVRRYYYLRPKGQKFDVKGGFYLFYSETLTKGTSLLKKVDTSLLVKQPDFYDKIFDVLPEYERQKLKARAEAEKKQYIEITEYLSKLVYTVDAVTLRWGIPTISYYGTDPNPILFSDRKKIYDAGILNDVYLRILLTQKYGMFKKWIMITAISLAVIAIVLFLIFTVFKSQSQTINQCQTNLNVTTGNLVRCINDTAFTLAKIQMQNSTVNV